MKVGLDALVLDADSSTVRFSREGIELNLGAIGKGYALDRVAAEMRIAHVTHALLSAGRSSLLALGGQDKGWSIDLVSPLADAPARAVASQRCPRHERRGRAIRHGGRRSLRPRDRSVHWMAGSGI